MRLRLLLPLAVYAAILGVSSVPSDDLGAFPPALSYVGHALEYAALGATLRWALDDLRGGARGDDRSDPRSDLRGATALTVGAVLVLAGIDEVYQSTVPGRDPSVLDWVVDVSAAAAAAFALARARLRRS